MTDKTYRQAFEQAKADFADAVTRRTNAAEAMRVAEEQAIQLRRAVTALAALCGENVEDSMGLTEAVRAVAGANWFTSKNFIQQVERIGVSLADLKNPDASMLSVLNRLTKAGELEENTAKSSDGGSVKIWKKKEDDDIPF